MTDYIKIIVDVTKMIWPKARQKFMERMPRLSRKVHETAEEKPKSLSVSTGQTPCKMFKESHAHAVLEKEAEDRRRGIIVRGIRNLGGRRETYAQSGNR